MPACFGTGPGARREWKGEAERSGALLLDIGVHDFDSLRWSRPGARVSAVMSKDLGQAARVVPAHVRFVMEPAGWPR